MSARDGRDDNGGSRRRGVGEGEGCVARMVPPQRPHREQLSLPPGARLQMAAQNPPGPVSRSLAAAPVCRLLV